MKYVNLSTPNLVILSSTALAIVALVLNPSQGYEVAKMVAIGLIGFLSSETLHQKPYKGESIENMG